MKKPYQIEAQRAVKQLEAMAADDGNPAVQMVLPMAEMVGWLRKGVGELIRQAGLQLMDLVKQLEAMAADDGNPAVQMVLPMAEMVGWLRKGVGELIRQAGLQLMDLLMQEEIRGLA